MAPPSFYFTNLGVHFIHPASIPIALKKKRPSVSRRPQFTRKDALPKGEEQGEHVQICCPVPGTQVSDLWYCNRCVIGYHDLFKCSC